MKKKDPNVYPKGLSAARAARILKHYENQTEAESAAEIDRAPLIEDAVWVRVPIGLLPRIRKIINPARKSA